VRDPNDIPQAIFDIVIANAPIILYSLLITLVVMTLAICIHSFVTAGSVGIYVDSMRLVAANPALTRQQMNSFTTQRWLEGGKKSWWAVFWIYNIAWSVGLSIMLIPMAVLVFLVILLRSNGPAAAITGCLGVFVLLIVVIPVGVVTGIWTQKGIVDCVARGAGAMDSLRMAWSEFKLDVGRHLAIALIMFAVSFGAAILVGSMGTMANFGHQPTLAMVPIQFSTSILNSIVGAAVGAWFLACFAALAVERA